MCGSKNLDMIFDLGVMPIANAFVSKENLGVPEPAFPLALQFCRDCFSVQLSHTVDSGLIFKDYRYETSASRPLVEHFYALADEIADHHLISPNDLVVEIGSNDGTLLSRIKSRCRVLGIDPAKNVAELSVKNGVPTMVDFFTLELAQRIKAESGEAQVMVANNVMAHIDDLRGVFSAAKELLSLRGAFIFEVHWVGNLITKGGFDQIYHEHLYYHSLHALAHLMDSLGMIIHDIKLVPIHGESMRVYAGKSGKSSEAVSEFLRREVTMGLTEAHTYIAFAEKVESSKKELTQLLHGLKNSGKRIAGYGAPAKGNTLLNYFHIGPEVLDFITDTTPAKQGTYTPGTHIPVVSPEILKRDQPDYLLLLSWNYADVILEKEKELREKGVQFIIPVPEVRIV